MEDAILEGVEDLVDVIRFANVHENVPGARLLSELLIRRVLRRSDNLLVARHLHTLLVVVHDGLQGERLRNKLATFLVHRYCVDLTNADLPFQTPNATW